MTPDEIVTRLARDIQVEGDTPEERLEFFMRGFQALPPEEQEIIRAAASEEFGVARKAA